ncbi:MAG: DUF1444 family protein [Myxococcales bacterium]|nr:DUF1444 family protein [Myxococcales bacterium]
MGAGRTGDWIDDLGHRAGPLADCARTFLDCHGLAPQGAQGATGLGRLARLVEDHCDLEEVTEDDDRQFVEGAGAWLGLVLIDALGGGGYQSRDGIHRIHLGDHGYFDPFGAMQASLDSDGPRRELARHVTRAEAEAGGKGPIARVVRCLSRLLSTHPRFRIVDHFDLTLWLTEDVEIDLRRTVQATADQGDGAVEQAVQKLLSLLPGASGPATLPWTDAAPRLLPRLVNHRFFEQLKDSSAEGPGLVRMPVGHDVDCAFLLEFEGRCRFVRESEGLAWAVSLEALRERAHQNLASRSSRARFAAVETNEGPMVIAKSGDGLDAARLLLPSLRETLRPILGDAMIVAVPHRDVLMATPAHIPALTRALEARAADDASRAPHRITHHLFTLGQIDGQIGDPREFTPALGPATGA